MDFLKRNKGVILFYVLVFVSTLVLSYDAKLDEKRSENKYVMTYLAN